jgi:hypothetical protein
MKQHLWSVAVGVIASGAVIGQTQPGEVVGHTIIGGSGLAVASLGDLDGNGIDDLAVGRPSAGAVDLYFMQSGGVVMATQLLASGAAEDQFGASIAALGDLDGNGVTEVAVGAPRYDGNGFDNGAVHLLFLDPGGTVASTVRIADQENGFVGNLLDFNFFGQSLAGPGDLDGDGNVDLVVGTPGDHDGFFLNAEGAVWVLQLRANGVVQRQAKIADGLGGLTATLLPGDQFGYSLAAVGDIDNNGVNDLLAGAPGMGTTGTGAVFVLLLEPDGSVRTHRIIAGNAGGFVGEFPLFGRFGSAIASLGDLDEDGAEDFAVGTPQAGNGLIWVLFLDPDGRVKSQLPITEGVSGLDADFVNGADFGWALASAADLDGDGVRDLVSGVPGGAGGIGTFWLLFLNASQWSNLGGGLAGSTGIPLLTGSGAAVQGADTTVTLRSARPNAPAWLIAGMSAADLPFFGGNLVPAPDVVVEGFTTSAMGDVFVTESWPGGQPPDSTFVLQFWIQDPAGPEGFAGSNAVSVRTP